MCCEFKVWSPKENYRCCGKKTGFSDQKCCYPGGNLGAPGDDKCCGPSPNDANRYPYNSDLQKCCDDGHIFPIDENCTCS